MNITNEPTIADTAKHNKPLPLSLLRNTVQTLNQENKINPVYL